MTNVDWKDVVKGLKSSVDADRRQQIERTVREVAGEAEPLRLVRKGLLSVTLGALRGWPRLVAVHDAGVVVVIALDDFIDVVAEPGPTLGDVMGGVRRKPSKRRRVSEE